MRTTLAFATLAAAAAAAPQKPEKPPGTCSPSVPGKFLIQSSIGAGGGPSSKRDVDVLDFY